jgi:hypothetical protein
LLSLPSHAPFDSREAAKDAKFLRHEHLELAYLERNFDMSYRGGFNYMHNMGEQQ